MQSKAKTIPEYIRELRAERQGAVKEIHALIHRVAPKAEESIQYGMPTCPLIRPIFALTAQKNSLALRCCEKRSRAAAHDSPKGPWERVGLERMVLLRGEISE